MCYKAFCSLHGISKKKVEVIQSYIIRGVQPKNGCGQHTNRKHRLCEETFDAVCAHIASFKGKKSHYNLKDFKRTYLPPELNVSKMYNMFKEKYPKNTVSYEKYRKIFNEHFNITFGYPRQDTCSSCDMYAAEVRAIENGLKNYPDESSKKLEVEKKIEKALQREQTTSDESQYVLH